MSHKHNSVALWKSALCGSKQENENKANDDEHTNQSVDVNSNQQQPAISQSPAHDTQPPSSKKRRLDPNANKKKDQTAACRNQSTHKPRNTRNSASNGSHYQKTPDMTPKTYAIPNYDVRNANFDYLKVVSWNVNIEAHSAYASHNWIQQNDKWELVFNQCQQQDPDIISFQEISLKFNNKIAFDKQDIHPLLEKYINTKNWYITSSRKSHCGHTINLIHKRLENDGFIIDVTDGIDTGNKWPAFILSKRENRDGNISAFLKGTSDSDIDNIDEDSDDNQNDEERKEDNNSSSITVPKLLFFGTHLYYGQNNPHIRRDSIDRLYDVASQRKMEQYLVICGDTNMRDYEETKIIEDYASRLSTSWKIVPKNNSMFTCYKNYFQKGKPGVSRYDKLFYGSKIKCISFGIFDEHCSKDKHHFLSDHRAVVAVLEIQ